MSDIKIRNPGSDETGHRGHGATGPTGATGPVGPAGSTGATGPAGTGTGNLVDLSVNNASADLGFSAVVLRTGGDGVTPNIVGAFNGGGAGNKAILGLLGFNGMPISALTSIEYSWTSQLGPTGPFYNPPGTLDPTVPFINLIIDFNPVVGDLRLISLLDSSLTPAIVNVIGTYANPGGLNTLIYSWDATMDVLIVNAPPNPTPGGVPPDVSVGPNWPANAYSWAALVAANPAAIFVDAFPANPLFFPTGDGGSPAGAILPALLLASGDSGNLTKSGKLILDWKINGVPVT